jgi:hypothetical protein
LKSHIETITIGTTVSAVNVNNVFTSAYNNYKVIVNFANSTNTSNTQLLLRLRASGSDNSDNEYIRRGLGIGASVVALSDTSTGYEFARLTSGSTARTSSILEFRNPNVAKPSLINSTTFALIAGTPDGNIILTQHNVSSAFDGFSIIVVSGTLTDGTITIYGYED